MIENRDQRENDDSDNNQLNVLIRYDGADKVAKKSESYCPQQAPDDVIQKKCFYIHIANPCDNRSKGTDDRNKTGEDDSFSAVFFVKLIGFFYIVFMKKQRVLSVE